LLPRYGLIPKVVAGGLQIAPVGQERPNRWGMFGMSGGALEWCQDVSEPYKTDTAITDDVEDPREITPDLKRVARGPVVVVTAPQHQRTAVRMEFSPAEHNYFTGFRVARTIP
jgi:formylglycine-generating enzyme required for sulfatase activity